MPRVARCFTDLRAAAGSGHTDTLVAGTTSRLDWKPTDTGLSSIPVGPTGGRLAVTPTDGWIERDGAWVHGDAGGSVEEQVVAKGIIAYRQTQSPEFTDATVGAAPGYTVTGKNEVEVADGLERSLWTLRADGPFEAIRGVTTTKFSLSLDDHGIPLRSDLTATGAGLTSSSVQLFSRWGEPVDLSDIPD